MKPMRKLCILLFAVQLLFTNAMAGDLDGVDIPYEKFVLDNGLTLLVHEDHSSPQDFVAVYYNVGSRDERPGKTGFAHLFEHLMFNGSEHYDKEYYSAIQEVGGSNNGDTWFDRTRYYQTVPNTALDRVLWLESDRMGHLLGAITQEKLDQQRGVVQNEKRRSDNQPYGLLNYRKLAALFPEGHPYRWSTIGSMEDLNAASLEDVHEWFKEYYGAANTLLMVAGAVTSSEVHESVKLHFGDIPAGNPVSRIDDWVPRRADSTFEVMQDRAPNPMISRNWVAPGRDHREAAQLLVAAKILGGDSSSRLHKRLVKDSGLAVAVSLGVQAHDLASVVGLSVILKPDSDPDAVRAIIDAEMRQFVEDGPSKEELALTKTAIAAEVIKGIDSLASRALYLAESEFYLGHPEAYKQYLSWIDTAGRRDVREVVVDWLGSGFQEILVEPFGEHKTADSGVDRSALPVVSEYPSAIAPNIVDRVLSNGIKVRLVQRTGVPAISIGASFEFGEATALGATNGVYAATVAMLDKGTHSHSADDIKAELKRTGSSFSVRSGPDETRFFLSTLTSRTESAVDLFADILRSPSFDEAEFDVQKQQMLTGIEFQRTTPSSLATRYVNQEVFGEEHPYGAPPTTETDVVSLSEADLRGFHERWFRPDQLTLVAVGGIDEQRLIDALEKSFGSWKADDPAPTLLVTKRDPVPTSSKVILFDAPGAPQSNIVAAKQISAAYGSDHESLELANKIYGGSFTSRINMNIREEKGWSYGVRSSLSSAVGTRLWQISAQVQTEKTAAAITELLNELSSLSGDRSFTTDELTAVRNQSVRSLSRATATTNSMLSYVLTVLSHDLPDDFIERREAAYGEVSISDMTAAMQKHIEADQLVWFIAGDIAKIEDEVRALNLGPLEIWNADGERIR